MIIPFVGWVAWAQIAWRYGHLDEPYWLSTSEEGRHEGDDR